MPRRALAVTAAAAVLGGAALGVAGCAPGSVRLALRAAPGSHYRYDVDVHAVTTTTVEGRSPTRQVTDEHMVADHRIVAANAGGVVVDVQLHGEGVPDRTFRVRLDRAAALTDVERVEDLPAEVLGDLGLSEVFPAAAGAPPNRPLRPGARWSLDQPVRLPDAPPSRLRGDGMLEALGIVDGRSVATVRTTYTLPVRQQVGDATISGSASTTIKATRAVADGAVVVVDAHTTGRFTLALAPPGGIAGRPVPGTVTVDVRSTTRRTN